MITRRRALTILAGATLLPATGATASTAIGEWSGIALGAEARIVLEHADADRLIASAVSEIHRLEGIFSLYQPDSQLSRLNNDGILPDPGFEMIELLSVCAGLHARTNGAFDPTVQTLWALYAQAVSQGSSPSPEDLKAAMDRTGWQHVRFSGDEVSFARRGMGLTLNGIAQGYIADRITQLFRDQGVSNVLVNTGEISALGRAPDGGSWNVTLANSGPNSGANSGRTQVPLSNAAIATSAPLGTTFDANGRLGHILDPRTGLAGGQWSQVSVVSNSAARADGLSTAFCLMNKAEIAAAREDDRVFLR